MVHMHLASVGLGSAVGMLSVAKLVLGQERYYEQQVAVGLDDNSAGRGESRSARGRILRVIAYPSVQ